jgi:outer membrane receptor protein involved in Fe transport
MFDASATIERGSLALTLYLQNISDKNYYEEEDYPAPGRRITLLLCYRFSSPSLSME